MLLLKNLAATTSAIVARLDRLEGAHFDARGPADLSAIGSTTTIGTPESLIKVCSSAQVSNSTGSSSAGDLPTAECEQAPSPAPAEPSPQTVVDFVDVPPCSTSIQLFKNGTVDSDCGSLALDKNNDSSGELGGAFAPAAVHDEAALVKIQTFVRRCAVRLRLRNECGLENVCIIKSQVLCSVSPWFSPVTPGSPSAARHLAAARVIAGFVDRDVIKWLLTRRRLGFRSAARLVQKWFRGVLFNRLAMTLFLPFVGSSTTAPMPSWCIHRVHIAWVRTGPTEWSQWVLSFRATALQFLNHVDLRLMPASVRTQQMTQFAGCRQWPWRGQIHQQSNYQLTSPARPSTSFHSLVHPLWAASFWRNADASLKHGVRLAHQQQSHAAAIPDVLLRWGYGLAPDFSPPAKIDWRRGASRRRRRANRGPSTEFLLSVDDTCADEGDDHGNADHDDDDAGDADNGGDAGDDVHDNAADNDDGNCSIERDRGHDDRHDDLDGGAYHHDFDGDVDGHRALDVDDDDVDGHHAVDGDVNDNHDGDFEHGDANYGEDECAHDQYDDRDDDRTDY